MSHHHDHSHDHHHDHSHAHSHGPGGEMPFADKLARLLEHWIQHNDDHIRSYREWAEKARSQGFDQAAERIDKAAEITAAVTEAFEKARRSV